MSTLKQKFKKTLGWSAFIALVAGLILPALISSQASALELEFNIPGEEEWCDDQEGSWISCAGEEGTSFIDFDGDFVPPDADGYAEGITQTSSAREFVVNVTNFVLSFLGLSAVIVIIYGGFLYVTAGGEQEKADKGKKSVMYAVMGILIVLISYALVNTIIQGAAGGDDATSSDALYSAGGVTSESMSLYQSKEMLDIISGAGETFIEEYTRFLNIAAILDAMANVGSFNDDGLDEMAEGFGLIQNETSTYSDSYDMVREAEQFVNRYISYNNPSFFTQFKNYFTQVASAGEAIELNVATLNTQEYAAFEACWEDCSDYGIYEEIDGDDEDFAAYQADTVTCWGECNTDDVYADYYDPYEVAADVISDIHEISDQSAVDFVLALSEIYVTLDSMQGSFEGLTLIDEYFERILEDLEGYEARTLFLEREEPKVTWGDSTYDTRTFDYTHAGGNNTAQIYTSLPGGSGQIGEVIGLLNNIYLEIETLEFTTSIIEANTKEGNAPLTVTFNGLDSYDPSEQSIIDDTQYEWDLLGNGFNGGDDVNGPNVSYTYEDPGTYRVALRVNSSTPESIASGMTYLSVKVNPPSSIIDITAQCQLAGSCSDAKTLEETGATRWTFTGEQARSGIVFDAAGTTDGDGNENTIINFDFDYDDGESDSGESSTATHYYEAEGKYDFTLEVTDQNGVTDRQRIDLIVASPAADISASATSGQIGDTISFDASDSITDNGSINNYTWTIYKDGVAIELTSDGATEDYTTSPTFEFTFDEPGEYEVVVSVLDSNNESNEDSLIVTIEASEPTAAFDYKILDTTQPARVHLDASYSDDPDREGSKDDNLTYEWTIDSNYYELVDGDLSSEQLIIDFQEVGDHELTLTVYNDHEAELQKSNSYTRKITIDSILNIEVSVISGTAVFLDEKGVAEVEVNLFSDYMESFEVEWSDGSDPETIPAEIGEAVLATHKYDAAGTYPVSAIVYGPDNQTNEMTRNVYIGNGETPIPIIKVFVEDVESADANEVSGTTVSQFKFDASESLDFNGKMIKSSSSYNWNFGNSDEIVTGDKHTVKYDDTGIYEVTLTIKSPKDESKTASATITVNVEESEPVIHNVTVTLGHGEYDTVTPVTVDVDVTATDEDGEIISYKVWYYDVDNTSEQINTQVTTDDPIIMTINTNGISGEEKEYGFVVEVTDDDNNTVSSLDQLAESNQPIFEVENGTNVAPLADFTVNKTSVMMGETVVFTSSSSDEDGDPGDLQYNWDLDGDGFSESDWTDGASVSHEYNYVDRNGIEARLKVKDADGATAVSETIRIYVDSTTEDPEAKFDWAISDEDQLMAEFTDSSIFYTEENADDYEFARQWFWDLDGDGSTDSEEQNPTYTYETTGGYSVTLTVMDEEGNESDPSKETVTIAEIEKPNADFEVVYYDKYEDDDAVEWYQVEFVNKSSVGEGADPLTYEWFMDLENLNVSSDGVVSPDYTVREPGDSGVYTYELSNYGDAASLTEIKVEAKLLVQDNLGRTDEKTETISLALPVETHEDLVLTLGAYGQDESQSDTYTIVGDEGDVNFYFLAKNVEGTAIFCLDQDHDWNSDNTNGANDDCDPISVSSSSMSDTVYEAGDSELVNVSYTFQRAYSTADKITATLHVVDDESESLEAYLSGDESRGASTTFYIKFEDEEDEISGATSMLPVTSVEALYILAIAFSFTLIGAKIYIKQGSDLPSDY